MTRVIFSLLLCLLFALNTEGQNLVPNASFEALNACELMQPDITCSQAWSDYLNLDPINTPDIGYEGAVFFPPSTIDAYDGDQYLNIECSTGNPEYAQVDLIAPMVAGTSYCVSFYASVSQESNQVAPSLGAYFTNAPLTDSPFELGIDAHVQGAVEFDPTSWTLVTGTYTAAGGENILVLAGFENTGTMPFPYMYIDAVSVIAMPPLILADVELCNETLELNAAAPGATYVWSTGATTASIIVNASGIYTIERTIGTCTQETDVEVLECSIIEEDTTNTDSTDMVIDDDTLVDPMDDAVFEFYIPNAFTPDGDGKNDLFAVIGEEPDRFLLQIFNRWGQLVFETSDMQKPWTGNHTGGSHYAQDGIYVYRMQAIEGTELYEVRGHVVLMR